MPSVGAAVAQVTSTGEAWQTEHVVCMRRCDSGAVDYVDVYSGAQNSVWGSVVASLGCK